MQLFYRFINFRNGEKWQQARTAVNQPMMQPRMAKLFVPKIDQVAIDLIKRFRFYYKLTNLS